MTTMPWIQTGDGRAFPLLTPTAEDVRWNTLIDALAKLCRFTGHTTHFYSVAEHCCRVADILPPDRRLYGLLHDAAEAYTGDVSTPVKAALHDLGAGPALDNLEDGIAAAIHQAAGLPWLPPGDTMIAVKRADLVLLATERRDLMPAGPPWDSPLPDPLRAPIRPWPWIRAVEEFHSRLRRWLIHQPAWMG